MREREREVFSLKVGGKGRRKEGIERVEDRF